MNKTAYKKIIIISVILITAIYCNQGHSEPVKIDLQKIDAEQLQQLGIGRDDPFAQLSGGQSNAFSQLPAGPKPDLFVATVALKFLSAENLQKALKRMSSPYGEISIDDATNSLIICDSNEVLARIIEQIKSADRTPEQIMIEVVIADVQLTDDTELGVNWDRLLKATDNLAYKQKFIETFSTTTVASAGADLSLINTSISGILHALQETKDVEILASPRIMVVSGKTALIKTIEEIPYTEASETSEGGSLTSIEFKEVGVSLQVSPTITDDGKIIMRITPEQSTKTGEVGAGDVPIVDTRKADTTLLMEDGQVLVIGGLRKKKTSFTREQVPLLGDIPFLGMLFSSEKKEVEDSELLVIISPHIYKGERIEKAHEEKFDEITKRPTLQLPDKKPSSWFAE